MKLKSVEVKNFWYLNDIKWHLLPNVNIITGSNGAGKSTLLDLIACLLVTGSMDKSLKDKSERIIIEFDDSKKLINTNYDNTLLELSRKAKTDPIFHEIWNDVQEQIKVKTKLSRLNRLGISTSVSYIQKGRNLLRINEQLQDLKVDVISTFDSTLPSTDEISRLPSLQAEGVRSMLDLELHRLEEKYAYYLSGLASKLELWVKEGNTVDADYVKELYSQKDLFVSIVNEMFKQTNKHINIEASHLDFIIDNSGKHLKMYQLSSGEKQLLYILMTVLMQERQEYILFMDEPEISLHIDWQEQLIDQLLLLNPNCQIIIATHAPSLLLRGWNSAVANMDDIKR